MYWSQLLDARTKVDAIEYSLLLLLLLPLLRKIVKRANIFAHGPCASHWFNHIACMINPSKNSLEAGRIIISL